MVIKGNNVICRYAHFIQHLILVPMLYNPQFD